MVTKSVVSLAIVCSMFAHLQAMEQKRDLVKVQVDDRTYDLTNNQVQESETLSYLYKKQGDKETIVLPEKIKPEVFDYIIKDLNNKEYNSNELDDSMINQLFLAAVYLKIPQLIEKYTNITTDRITDLIILVGSKEYVMTLAQAQQSKTLKHILEDVEDYATPIPLPNLSEQVFDYLYNDLINVPYDSASLSDAIIVDLINAANYLDVEVLLKKYLRILVKRIASVDSVEQLNQYLSLIEEKLPEEMQKLLTKEINKTSIALFTSIAPLIMKPIFKADGYIYMSPDKKTYILKKFNGMYLIDTASNKIRSKIDFLDLSDDDSSHCFFSSNSSQFLVNNQIFLKLFDAATGKEIWKYPSAGNFGINKILSFISDIERIVIYNFEQDEILVIDSGKGTLISKFYAYAQYQEYGGLRRFPKNEVEQFFYDSNTKDFIYKAGRLPRGNQQKQVIKVINLLDNQSTTNFITVDRGDVVEIIPHVPKIVTISNELISVENIHDKKDSYSWVLKKPLSDLDVRLFWSSDKLIVVAMQDKRVYILDTKTGATIWAKDLILTGLITNAMFIDETEKLLIITPSAITNLELKTKKEIVIKNNDQEFKKVFILSPSLFGGVLDIDNSFIISINNLLNGKEIVKLEIKKNAFATDMKLIKSLGTNVIFVRENLIKSRSYYAFFYNIAPLIFISRLNEYSNDLRQALLIIYIFNLLQQNKLIPIKDIAECGYDDLPQEIQSLVENHNERWMKEEAKNVTNKLKKTKRFQNK